MSLPYEALNATPHHVGCAVAAIDTSYATYGPVLGLTRRTREIEVPDQGVRVCFVELRDGFFLELVAPTREHKKFAPYLKIGFYHLCFLVADLEAEAAKLLTAGFHQMPHFASEAFAGARCQFLMSPDDMHLIELAEMSAHDFQAHFERNLFEGSATASACPG